MTDNSNNAIGNMAQLIEKISMDDTLTVKCRQEELSACRSLCDWLHRPPHLVLIDPGNMRLAKEEVHKNPPAVSRGRRNNVLSHVRRALRRYQIGSRGPRLQPLSPAWEAKLAEVKGNPASRGVRRFGRSCSARGIEPEGVTQIVLDEFGAELEETSLARNVRGAVRGTCRAWNRMAKQFPEVWPQVELLPGNHSKVYALTLDQVAIGFRTDLEAMLSKFASHRDLPEGFSEPYAPRTIAEMRRIFVRLFSVAVIGASLPITSMADLVQYPVCEVIFDFYDVRFPAHNRKSERKYAHFLFVAAKYWVKADKKVLDYLNNCRRVPKSETESVGHMAPKNWATVSQFEDEARIAALLNHAQQAVQVFSRMPQPGFADALNLQVALAIELLLAAPVRSQNLCSVHLDRHLKWNFGQDEVRLKFPAHEVKNKVDLEFVLPERLCKMLRLYLDKAHPLIACAGCRYLFPGRGDRPKVAQHLSNQIARRTLDVLRARVTAHQFRHLVGFLYLRDHPGGHEVIRLFLGHKNIETTVKFYAGLEKKAAIEHVDRHLEGLRQKYAKKAA